MLAPVMSRPSRFLFSAFVLVAGCASQPATKAPRAKLRAAASELREECKKSFVAGFSIRGVAAFPADEDFCFLPASEEMPAPVADLLRQIGATHEEAALKLGVPFAKLAPNGVRIQLATGPGSTSIQPPNKVTLGVFPDWHGHAVAAGDYIHELGHVIAFGTGAPGSPLPRSLETTWGQNMLLGEAFADLVTVHLTGKRRFAMSNHGGVIPNGLVFQTVIADKLTFEAPAKSFLHGYRFVQMGDRCQALKRSGFEFSSGTAQYCDEFQKSRSRWLARLPNDWILEAPFDPTLCINESGEMLEYQLCNPHPIGEVIVSFLLDLAESTGQDPMAMFLHAIKASTGTKRFSCGHVMTESDPPSSGRRTTAELGLSTALFRELEAALPAEHKAKFPKIWKAHGLDAALALDALESKQGPVASAKSFLRIFFTQSGTPAMNQANYPCWGKLDDTSGACKLTCHAIE
jgi:hypothetical protein